MSTKQKWQAAEQLYDRGRALYQEDRIELALVELRRSADAYRRLDARGNVFNRCLPNGVTGLANALALAGKCHFRMGALEPALDCFETASINGQFERPAAFRAFRKSLLPDIIACYEDRVRKNGTAELSPGEIGRIDIDTACSFPYSLPRDLVPAARLYELAPERYGSYSEFYQRAKDRDRTLRSADKDLALDGARMYRATVSIWTVLGALWALYTIIVFKALFPDALRAVMAP